MTPRFAPHTAAALEAKGWRLAHAPAGVTLSELRAAGAPFKSDKFFARQAAGVTELPVAGGDVAYRPGLMPGSVNETFGAVERLVAGLARLLPPGAAPALGPAALYVWLLVDHHRRHGEWLLRQCFTWAADPAGETRLAVGVMGQTRPLIVSPIPEPSGRGLGALPLVFPAGDAGTLTTRGA